MASNAREERRRRIVERGNDRLALITGQVRALGDSPSPHSTPSNRPQHHHSHTESSPSILFSANDQPQINATPGVPNDASSGSKLAKLRTINECSPGFKAFDRANPKPERVPEIIKNPVFDTTTRTRSLPSTVILPSVPKPQTQAFFFSSKRLNCCIIASKKIRAIASLTIAILAVISNIECSIFGFDNLSWTNFIVSRPFCLILLTDITIVLLRLLCEPVNFVAEETEEDRKADGDNWDGAVKLLERGLVLYQATRGLFVDCSIYLVLVISGLSLV